MNYGLLQTTLKELNIPIFIEKADHADLVRMIASAKNDSINQSAPKKLTRYGFIYERQGIRTFKQFVTKQENADRRSVVEYFQKAFICWHTLALLLDHPGKLLNGNISSTGKHFVEAEFRDEPLPAQLSLAFRLAASGLLAECTAEMHLDLKKIYFPLQGKFQLNWRNIVTEHIFSAFILLVRKDKSREDVCQALTSMNALREMQHNYEENYLESLEEPEKQASAALELVGFYHLAQLITLVGEYLQTGEPRNAKINLGLDRHHEQSIEAFDAGGQPLSAHLGDLLWVGCRELVQ